jgi:Na+-transporting NADH:ubiquinone oxidoreductase subunit NqrB
VRRPVQELRTLADGNVPASGPDAVMQVMRDQMPPWEDTLIGVVPGGIGETSAFVLILAGIVLVVRGVLPWQLPVAALTSAALACAVLPIRIGPEQTWIWAPAWILARGEPVGMVYMLYHMTAGQLLLGVTLLAADPSVSPLTRTGMIRYGLIIGLSTVLMRLYGVLDGECYWSILAANTVAARLDPLRSRR